MEPIKFEETIKTAGEAYAILKQTSLAKPIKDGALQFTKWFGELFTRKLHKEKIALMEQLSANEEVIKMLQLELEVQAEENETLKQEINQKLKEYRQLKNSPDYPEKFSIANSYQKNVVNAPISNITGNITIGDVHNK